MNDTPPARDDVLRQRIETALEDCRTLTPAALADVVLPLVAEREAEARAAALREAADDAAPFHGTYSPVVADWLRALAAAVHPQPGSTP
jgi:hypothetical protein